MRIIADMHTESIVRHEFNMCMHSTFVRDLNSRKNPKLFEILLFGEHCHM